MMQEVFLDHKASKLPLSIGTLSHASPVKHLRLIPDLRLADTSVMKAEFLLTHQSVFHRGLKLRHLQYNNLRRMAWCKVPAGWNPAPTEHNTSEGRSAARVLDRVREKRLRWSHGEGTEVARLAFLVFVLCQVRPSVTYRLSAPAGSADWLATCELWALAPLGPSGPPPTPKRSGWILQMPTLRPAACFLHRRLIRCINHQSSELRLNNECKLWSLRLIFLLNATICLPWSVVMTVIHSFIFFIQRWEFVILKFESDLPPS